ncbi:MAG: SUMF1/EgtB/PvdO family nonheme iron enzyme [Anaerohalosphaera sp.]|nr:SUMF1/EgtB/PvdO family nonheme iron enzyme [Anaerohalosphaera sp.]
MDLDASNKSPLTKTNSINYDESGPFPSPDGNKIAYWKTWNDGGEQNRIWWMDSNGTSAQQLVPESDVRTMYYPVFLDSQRLAYTRWLTDISQLDQIHIYNVTSGIDETVAFKDESANDSDAFSLQDSDWMGISSTRSAGHGGYDLYIGNLQTGTFYNLSYANTALEELGGHHTTISNPPSTRSLIVNSTPQGAGFTLSGKGVNTFEYVGVTPWSNNQIPAGNYEIVWEPLDGYITPLTKTKYLTSSSISFNGDYTVVILPPFIDNIDNDSTIENFIYTGLIPNLSLGTPPITWSLPTAPNGMTINSETGIVSWPNPVASSSSYEITIRADNSVGFDDETWYLIVNVDTPDVVGLLQQEAETTLLSSNLSTGNVTCAISETVSEGCVISQSPTAHSGVPYGSSVDLEISLGIYPNPDVNRDGQINIIDIQDLGLHWLETNCIEPTRCEHTDIDWSGRVDLLDFMFIAQHWLEGTQTDSTGMVWVYIDDPGVSGHEGFNGGMSKYETTNAQYCQFLNAALVSGDVTVGVGNIVYGANGSNSGEDFVGEIYFDTYAASPYSQIIYSNGTFSVRSRDGYSMANHPVVEVSWFGATAFCNYYGYRLPTEWEWQAVADYDGSYIYGCGTTISHSKANYDYENPLNLSSQPYTSPVDHYPSYGYGMNDMAGNVFEWTTSWFQDSSYRLVRSGCWSGSTIGNTVEYLTYMYPGFPHGLIGFRVCRGPQLNDGLVAYYPFDADADDASGNGYDGTEQGGVSYVSGVSGQAASFDGSSDYVSIPDSADWTFASDFTICLWVKFDAFNSNWWESAFVGHDEGGGQTNKWILSYDPASKSTLFHINTSNSNSSVIQGSSWTAQVGAWYFIAVTRNGNLYTFYRDGVVDGSQIDTVPIPDAAAPLTIGWAEGGSKFDGVIDNVRIYDRALLAGEISDLYDE